MTQDGFELATLELVCPESVFLCAGRPQQWERKCQRRSGRRRNAALPEFKLPDTFNRTGLESGIENLLLVILNRGRRPGRIFPLQLLESYLWKALWTARRKSSIEPSRTN